LRVLAAVHHRTAAAGVFADPRAELVEWLPHEAEPPPLDEFDAALLLGAEAQVDQEDSVPWLRGEKQVVRELLERGRPVLGVCFGSQLLAEALGGEVRAAAEAEVGWHEVELTPEGRTDPLLGFLPQRFESLQWHSYEWLLPPGAVALASSARCLQAFRHGIAWGVQFHPEVTEADYREWLDEFRDDPAALRTGLDPEAVRAETAAKIGAWNAVGRELFRRFLDEAAATAA
jgi:GMP synthase-like glutamine amidotransferase